MNYETQTKFIIKSRAGLFPTQTIMILGGIIPIPIFTGGGGHASPNALISLLLAINFFLILTAVIRSFIWYYHAKVKQDKYFDSYFEYVIWSDFDTSFMTGLTFLIVNGIALLFWVATLFMDWLDKVNPAGG